MSTLQLGDVDSRPHLTGYKVRYITAYSTVGKRRKWVCISKFFSGHGYSPLEAYLAWKNMSANAHESVCKKAKDKFYFSHYKAEQVVEEINKMTMMKPHCIKRTGIGYKVVKK